MKWCLFGIFLQLWDISPTPYISILKAFLFCVIYYLHRLAFSTFSLNESRSPYSLLEIFVFKLVFSYSHKFLYCIYSPSESMTDITDSFDITLLFSNFSLIFCFFFPHSCLDSSLLSPHPHPVFVPFFISVKCISSSNSCRQTILNVIYNHISWRLCQVFMAIVYIILLVVVQTFSIKFSRFILHLFLICKCTNLPVKVYMLLVENTFT